MKTWTAAILLILILVPGAALAEDPNAIILDAHWFADFGTGVGDDGDSKYLFSGMWFPHYKDDGGIGVIGIGDDTGDGDQSLIVGPGVEFPLGPAYRAVVSTLLPDPWAEMFVGLAELVRPYGRAGGLFDEDFRDVSPLIGTSLHIRPNRHIQIIPRADWVNPQGRGKELIPTETWIFSVNAGIAF
jgi:hypothetical protein